MSYVQGNTIRLRRVFTDFNGQPYDPTDITLKLFDVQRVQIGETIAVGATHKIAVGVYEVDVVLPEGYDLVTYKFVGTDPRGNPDLESRTIPTPWSR